MSWKKGEMPKSVRRKIARAQRRRHRGGVTPLQNGHLTLNACREHGAKYLSARREVLLSEVDKIDAALKLMEVK